MTSRMAPICYGCAHLLQYDYPELKCKAFPDGVPMPIVDGAADHRKRYEGDNGIVFSPKTFDDDRYASSIFDVDPPLRSEVRSTLE